MSDAKLAPVALFVFNRPQLTAQTYERIRAWRPKCLLVIADGPRLTRPEDAELCRATRAIVAAPNWACDFRTNFSDDNLGCKGRLSSGLDWVFQQVPEAIVLEDDCRPAVSFFDFCSAMLARYRDDPRIMHISGDNFQGGSRRGDGSYFFSRYPFSWGWASWRRAWQHYDVNVSWWPTAYREHWLETILDNPQEIRYWEGIFDKQYRGQIDTWDYPWVCACWRQRGLSILPNDNLVSNIGLGPDATHFTEGHSTLGLPTHELGELLHPAEIVQDKEADRFAFEHHILPSPAQRHDSWLLRMKRRLALRARVQSLVPRSLRYR